MAKPKIYQVDQLQTMVGTMNTAITTAHNQANSAYAQANSGGGPKIKSVVYPGDDLAANTVGGQTIYLTGSGFLSNTALYINNASVPSTSFISASNIAFTTPALATGYYPIYAINPTDGGTAIYVPGLLVSGEPTWNTAAGSLNTSQDGGSAWNYTLSANGDAPITYALAAGSSLPTGVSLAANGLISGTITSPPGSDTTYTFSVVASDAQYQDSTRQFSVTVTSTDPYFPYTTLLLHGDGTNNANNHGFIDSSNNNFTITRNGNATQGSFSPFNTGWSGYFDGSGDYMTIPYTTTAFDWWTTDFTVEAWVYPQGFTGWAAGTTGAWLPALVGNMTAASATANFWSFGPTGDGKIEFYYYNGTGVHSAISTGTLTSNVWNHIAMTKTSSGIKLFLNGVGENAIAVSGTPQSSATYALTIGSWTSSYIKGYVSNLRIIKGDAIYTGSTYTVPTSALSVTANTKYLTLQSNRFIDRNTTPSTITVTGDTRITPFSPFNPSAAYSTANNGGSVYFDGSGDYLDITDSSNLLDLGGAAKSVEGWFYPNGTATYVIFSKSGGTPDWNASSGFEWQIQFVSGIFNFYYNSSTTPTVLTDSVTRPAYQWYHIAVATNASNAISLYINGTRVATATNAITKTTSRTLVRLGQDVSGNYYNGYVSGLRFLSGANAIDPTQSTITVPSAPPTAISGTQLLYNFTNAGIIDNAMMNVLETVGDAKISTAQYKYGTASMYFDGSGDRLTIPFTNDFLELGINGQKFTIEAWIYPTNTMASTGQILSKGGGTASWATTSGAQYQWSISSSALSWSFNSSGSAITVNSGTVTLNTWQHVAVSYDGTTTRTFLNGVQQATSTSSYTAPTTRNLQYIGMTQSGGYTQDYYGYIDDFRITKGYARYTSNFTAPTSAFKDR